jgi:hypothetical protein
MASALAKNSMSLLILVAQRFQRFGKCIISNSALAAEVAVIDFDPQYDYKADCRYRYPSFETTPEASASAYISSIRER